ncbi:Uncharacterized protein Rs2_05171 [Raphanus sativus]|uniref:Uncharacterized protein LOC108826512 n=1 Tax=Raphanus sativus TaxID=3726 RepID=A0A6J0L7B3_RAPSA|nr:uncharacterized protein LOC108826512 [Raphanus sativus]XP_018455395.1 uncharacterized protein LOC108826512 [Raphanus sativus]KAJ4910550.1 Uncharacterized protein Rs2_05171 [Raphanus sativus]
MGTNSLRNFKPRTAIPCLKKSVTVNDVLITSTYVHINCGSKFAEYASHLSTKCPRILPWARWNQQPRKQILPNESSWRERLSEHVKRAVRSAHTEVLQHKKPTSNAKDDITGV